VTFDIDGKLKLF